MDGDRIGGVRIAFGGVLKVKGAAVFSAEFRFDDVVYAALAYATIPRGRIMSIDSAAADEQAGRVLAATVH